MNECFFFFSSRRRHTSWTGDWSSDVCSSDLDLVASILRICCADISRVDPEAIARHVEVAAQRAGFPGIEADFAAAVRSVVRTVGYPHGRAYGRRIRSVTCPVLLIHGTADRLVPVAAARAAARANPSWSL